MRRSQAFACLFLLVTAVAASLGPKLSAGIPKSGAALLTESPLPKDIFPDSRSRLPLIKRDGLDEKGKKSYDEAASASGSGAPEGVAAIRLHGSGVDVRWTSPLGRRFTELAILATARERDQPYEWSLHELEVLSVGLEPPLIDIVRQRKSLKGVGEKEAAIIQVDREVIGMHQLTSRTYASALKLLGETNLVDIVSLMGQYAGTGTRLTAFNQQMPPQMKQFLPLPFTLPDDIHLDSRSRLPLIKTPPQAPPLLYSREIAPTGTGPQQLASHQAGRKSLESHIGQRLMELAILVTAREHDQQYDWTIHELAARKQGLEPRSIDVVRDRGSLTELGEQESAIIQFGRELFGKHFVTAGVYARALKIFGETDLADLVDLMAQHSTDAALLTAFDQHLPSGQNLLLPPVSGRN